MNMMHTNSSLGNDELEKEVVDEVESSFKIEQKQPSLYEVVAFNDDFTPMDFVIDVLQSVFSMSEVLANQVMLKIHNEGQAVCGVYSRDIAETKSYQSNSFSQKHQHPLLTKVVKVE